MGKEIWKDIPGYEGSYQVSNFGQVKSLKYGRWGNEPKILKPFKDTKGYYRIELMRKAYSIHTLVAMAFLGHTPDGTMKLVVNHIDNNQLNNHVDNLELVSNRYNSSCHKNDPGVSWYTQGNKWKSKIYINNKQIHLGYFTDKQDAIDMYQKAVANTHLYNGDAKAFRLALTT